VQCPRTVNQSLPLHEQTHLHWPVHVHVHPHQEFAKQYLSYEEKLKEPDMTTLEKMETSAGHGQRFQIHPWPRLCRKEPMVQYCCEQ
jgi:hypothetical protein